MKYPTPEHFQRGRFGLFLWPRRDWSMILIGFFVALIIIAIGCVRLTNHYQLDDPEQPGLYLDSAALDAAVAHVRARAEAFNRVYTTPTLIPDPSRRSRF